MNRIATAVWTGSLKEGKGQLTSGSGLLSSTPYNFAQRFGEEPGTNPEELIASAHAGCFAMAFSGELGKAGFTPTKIEAKATITLDMLPGGPTVTKSHLDVTVHVPGAEEAKVREIADGAKKGCPISRLLKADISMTLNVI
ncbi:MAG: OsmC family protein [Candidatus Zixiibacteriota bacterium]